MNIKKILVWTLIVGSVIVMCACSAKKNVNTEQVKDSGQSKAPAGTVSDSVTDPTKEAEVSIPTDSGLAESVFDNASDPTKPDAGKETNPEENNQTDDPADTTGNTDPEGNTSLTTPPEEMTYEDFVAMTPEQQRLYQESFDDLADFFEWYNAAKEKYEEENPPIEIDGPIDLGKY